jgi:CubicO group peptidase (beta-lactamase class C family)
MKPRHAATLLLALLLAACVQPGIAPEVLRENAPRTMPGGASYVVPAGWRLTDRGAVQLLAPPEGADSRIALVELPAADADAAVAGAWRAAGLPLRWPVQAASDQPPGRGWQQVRDYTYEVPANLQRQVTARALLADGKWTVLLTDFAAGLHDKRQSQVSIITGRLWAKGYTRESFAGRQPHALDAARVAALTELLTEGMRLYGIQGLSFGIVQDGKVVAARGLGVKELGKPGAPDADTNYIIASNTKQLTTLLLAKLVDQGKFTWQTPVQQLLPGFALGDAATTRKVLVQHLVCACTGLPRQDNEWLFEYQDATPASTLKTLATMQPTSEFGALYQYSNPLASAAGYVAAHVAHPDMELGAAYDKAMQELVFDPLGMKTSTFDFDRAMQGNFAMPYGADPDGNVAPANLVSNRCMIPLRPAGGLWSNVHDMLRYLQMELDGGLLPDGRRYIGEAALTERRRPKVAMSLDTSYGMGQRIDTSTGVTVVMHGGDLNGYKSTTFFLPEQRVAAVVLMAAADGDDLFVAFRRRVLELLFDGKETALPELRANGTAWRAGLLAERRRLAWPADPAEAARLAPHYRNAGMGPITVRQVGGETLFDFGEWQSPVASRRNEDGSISFVTTSPGMAGHAFVVLPPAEGGSRRLVTRTRQQEYVFEEVRPEP